MSTMSASMIDANTARVNSSVRGISEHAFKDESKGTIKFASSHPNHRLVDLACAAVASAPTAGVHVSTLHNERVPRLTTLQSLQYLDDATLPSPKYRKRLRGANDDTHCVERAPKRACPEQKPSTASGVVVPSTPSSSSAHRAAEPAAGYATSTYGASNPAISIAPPFPAGVQGRAAAFASNTKCLLDQLSQCRITHYSLISSACMPSTRQEPAVYMKLMKDIKTSEDFERLLLLRVEQEARNLLQNN